MGPPEKKKGNTGHRMTDDPSPRSPASHWQGMQSNQNIALKATDTPPPPFFTYGSPHMLNLVRTTAWKQKQHREEAREFEGATDQVLDHTHIHAPAPQTGLACVLCRNLDGLGAQPVRNLQESLLLFIANNAITG